MASSIEKDAKKDETVNANLVQNKTDRRFSISSKKPDNTDQRNFRSQYYEKVGFRGVDERKTLELLLNEDPINLNKIQNFALQFSIPSFDRIVVWKFMLGILRTTSCNREYSWSWKVRPYDDIIRSIQYLKTPKEAAQETNAEKHTHLWMILRNKMKLGHYLEQLQAWDPIIFAAIFESMLSIANEVEIDAYYLSHGLWTCLNERHSHSAMQDLVNFYHKTLSNNRTTSKLYSHCEKIGLNEEIPLWTWFSKGFAGVLHISALEKIWDKVIGGSIKILVYVALTKVELAQNVLLGCHTANEAIRSLNKTSEEDVVIAQKAIESWNKDGRQIQVLNTYSHSMSDKHKLQLSASENFVNIGYKEQSKDRVAVNPINLTIPTVSDTTVSIP